MDNGRRVSLYFSEADLHLIAWTQAAARKRRQKVSAFIVESIERRLMAEFPEDAPKGKGKRT